MPTSGTDENPESVIFRRDRRQVRRHLPYTPAYASVSGSSQVLTTDLSEIRDISPSGACVQFAASKQTGRLLPLCLELSETRARIYIVSHVAWSDASGKTGISFPDSPEVSRSQLKKWIGADERAANAARSPAAELASPGVQFAEALSKPAANVWTEIESEFESCGSGLQSSLDLIVQRALELTSAHGAAIALSNAADSPEMLCRARAGTESPGIGARLQSGSGFSGECVRLGEAIICIDAELDSRVDRESCHALGVRSIVAAPVKREGQTIGVIEIFSPEPAAFGGGDVIVLRRFALLIERAIHLSNSGSEGSSAAPRDQLETFEVSPFRRIALISASIFLIVALSVIALTITRVGRSTVSEARPSTLTDPSPDDYATLTVADLTTRATQEDARAQYALAMRYANATDVAQDYREARLWFLRAAQQGNVAAQAKIAVAFWEGKGGAQDYSKAYFWAALAQAGGDELSKQIVVSCAARLSPVQIAAERKQADEWLHSHHIGHATE